jgi:hypothetical protein
MTLGCAYAMWLRIAAKAAQNPPHTANEPSTAMAVNRNRLGYIDSWGSAGLTKAAR